MFRFATAFLALLAAPAYATLGAPVSRELQTTTVVDLAVATSALSTLVAAVGAADLGGALSDSDATLTVFAPTNDAFDALPAGLLDALLTPGFKQHLTEILSYHVFGGAAVKSEDLTDGQVITMLNNEAVTIGLDGGVTVTTTAGQVVNVVTPDVTGSNGVVHVVDAVLVPSTILADFTGLSPGGYSTLLSLVAVADLVETLAGGPFTLFAPTNDAFGLVDADTVAFLQTPEGKDTLVDILTYHVVPGSVTSDLIMDGMVVTTANMDTVELSVDANGVMVNDATVTNPDILTLNGVAHGINMVLMPPVPADATETDAPTMAPSTDSAAGTVGASAAFVALSVAGLALAL